MIDLGDFDALLTPHQVASLLDEETEHHAARRIALSVLLGQTRQTLVSHMQANPKLLEEAPRLLDCLERIAEGGSPDASLMLAAARRLEVAVLAIQGGPMVH